MEGENHVEIVVGPDGAIDLYISDSVRNPIPAKDVSGTLTIKMGDKAERLVLAEDVSKGSLSAKGPPPHKTLYTWDLKARGAPMKMSLEVPHGGTARIGEGAPEHGKAADHAHGAPHGGVVQTLGDGHVEAKLDKSGDVTVWLLDAAEKPRSAKGASVTIRLVAAGSKEVPLSYDATSDVLHGRVDPVAQEHVDALLTVTPAGGTATPMRFTFQLESKGHGAH
jgi:hypothetical protein